jgi:hypothetical protein
MVAKAEVRLKGNHEAGVIGTLGEQWFNDAAWGASNGKGRNSPVPIVSLSQSSGRPGSMRVSNWLMLP